MASCSSSSSNLKSAPPAKQVLRRITQHVQQRSPAATAPAARAVSSGAVLALGSTDPGGSLAQEALRRFEDDGYCVFPGFLDADHVSRLLIDLAQLPAYDGETRGRHPTPMLVLLSEL